MTSSTSLLRCKERPLWTDVCALCINIDKPTGFYDCTQKQKQKTKKVYISIVMIYYT